MTSYFARYQAGEHNEVWRDLRALDLTVFEVRHREDAQAVAREMAVRARWNVETLVDRLQADGFVAAENDDDGTPRPAHFPPSDGASALADWMEEAFAPFPMTVAAWIRQVGDVWLVGEHPRWAQSVLANPLVVEFEHTLYGGGSREYFEGEWKSWGESPHRDSRPFQLDFAPDALHKANISGDGPYGIVLAGSGVDGRLGPSTWFVDDLNAAFAAGGFPGALYSEGYVDPPQGLREGLARDLLRL
ncbi:hypothetical protein [Promicromonospora soli]|uniref:Uncharacterized protein n=1 Tax=Promicromonospora soli TaxID=2035533 RepID=A0A919G425_9MICO|nr:hypothetical protein [Promicromonospora soli]GHH77309.1 hypothetical protein GCM10017772_37960 [Promicromonospora soli]